MTGNLQSQFLALWSNTLHTQTTLASSHTDPCLSTTSINNSNLSQKDDCNSWWCFSHAEVLPKPPLKHHKTASLVKCVHNKHMPLQAVHHLAQCTLLVCIQLDVPETPASSGTTIYFTQKLFITRHLKVNVLSLRSCSDSKIIWPHTSLNHLQPWCPCIVRSCIYKISSSYHMPSSKTKVEIQGYYFIWQLTSQLHSNHFT